jgi:DNA-binding MarR family transcriptional regulator
MPKFDDAVLDEIIETFVRTARAMSAVDGASTDSGHAAGITHVLTVPQMLLAGVLERRGPQRMGEVAALLRVKPPAASGMVDALERAGYVERVADLDDRRATQVRLTDAGHDALIETTDKVRDFMREGLSGLSHEDAAHIIRIHRSILARLREQD